MSQCIVYYKNSFPSSNDNKNTIRKSVKKGTTQLAATVENHSIKLHDVLNHKTTVKY